MKCHVLFTLKMRFYIDFREDMFNIDRYIEYQKLIEHGITPMCFVTRDFMTRLVARSSCHLWMDIYRFCCRH